MADRFISIYEVLFDASAATPIQGKSRRFTYNIGEKEGMTNVGEEKDEVLTLDKREFRAELNRLMSFYDKLDSHGFFELVHAAYNEVNADHNDKSMLFYHIHNPDTYAQLNFIKSAPHSKWILMVREPIQSCESWIRSKWLKYDYKNISTNIVTMLFALDDSFYSLTDSIGVRLEDLKEHPNKTIPALCGWMNIKEADSLYEMTAQGKKWWGDPSSPDFDRDGMEPFGQTSLKRKVGSIFSEGDQFILRTLFYPFSVQFNYVEENSEKFKADLQTIRPKLDQIFDFEKTILEHLGLEYEEFKNSCSYLYLREGLISRWNTLNEHHTYPNLIEPLKIIW